jgi:hypothetical protein
MYIQRSLYQEEKPTSNIERDHRGILIQPGLRVAYNLSGDVVIGTIVEVKKNQWVKKRGNWRLEFEIHIQLEGESRISKVKNPNAFVII